MVNKVVQLQNKDGDNLYPLSGGTASDSITTDMLQDGSVTSDKIDFTEFVFAPGVRHQVGMTGNGKKIYRTLVAAIVASDATTGSVAISTDVIPENATIINITGSVTLGNDVASIPYYSSSTDYMRVFLRKSNSQWNLQCRKATSTYDTTWRIEIIFYV